MENGSVAVSSEPLKPLSTTGHRCVYIWFVFNPPTHKHTCTHAHTHTPLRNGVKSWQLLTLIPGQGTFWPEGAVLTIPSDFIGLTSTP